MTALAPSSRLGSLLLSLLLLGVLTGCGNPRTAPPIVVGNVAPRSGPLREMGLHAEEGIRLAVEEVKAGESLLPDRAVEVRHADSEDKPETAQNVAVRLLSVNQAVALIATTDAASAKLLCQVGQQAKVPVPVLTTVWLPLALVGPNGFCIGPTAADQGKALARFAGERLKPSGIAMLVDSRSPACLARAAAFAEMARKDAVIRRDEFTSEEELAKLVPAVSAAKADAIFFAGTAADLEKLSAKLREISVPPKLAFLFAGEEEPRLVVLADRWADTNDLYWTTAFVPDDAPPAQEFIKKYRERYQRLPDADAALAYDGARLLFAAIRQAKTSRPDRLCEELAKLKDFPSLTGPVSFEKNQLTPRPVFVIHRENKEWKWHRAANDKGEAKPPGKPAGDPQP